MTDVLEASDHLECAVCGHEWPKAAATEAEEGPRVVRDANGNMLNNGDAVVLVKDLKLGGTSASLKVGTKVRSIRIVDGDHEIDCKVDGISVMLKAAFVKKA